MEDWIAAHEISHLAIPHVGRSNSWFAEGFATFMCRQVMLEMGYYTEEELAVEYYEQIAAAGKSFDSDEPFTIVAKQLIEKYNYSHMYRGSMSFYYFSDLELKKDHNTSMIEVVQQYQLIRPDAGNMQGVVESFDEITGTTMFTDRLRQFQTVPAREIFTSFY